MNDLLCNHKVVPGYKWRGRGGKSHYEPRQMETRHLFMTLVVIWNATMPEDRRIHKTGSFTHHLYYFGPEYTRDYLIQSIKELATELSKRSLPRDFQHTLVRMMSICRDNPALISQ